jgi:hypothetical protein
MRYAVEGEDLCIRIPLSAIVRNATTHGGAVSKVLDASALAMSVGRELIDCETMGEEFFLNGVLDAAIERVIESADPSLEYSED